MGSPESLLSKDPLYQKIAKFVLLDKVAGTEIHREASAVSGEQTGLYLCVSTSTITLFLTVGSPVGPRWSQELPLEPGATASAYCCAESRHVDCAGCVKSAVRWAR